MLKKNNKLSKINMFNQKDFIDLKDFNQKELESILKLATALKKKKSLLKKSLLKGKNIGLLFNKESTRTRIAFEVAINQLGGHCIFLQDSQIQMSCGEDLLDTAKVLERYLDTLIIRNNSYEDLIKISKNIQIPVINALTNKNHPCQILADFLTIQERKKNLQKIKIAYLGDGNNVAYSLAMGCKILNISLSVASPKKYQLEKKIQQELHAPYIQFSNDPIEACKQADVIYTDVWTSMGDKKKEKKLFQKFQINQKLLKNAKKDYIFLHCLPAHRGEEVTNTIIDSFQSCVFDQAENKLYTQKAILILLFN